MKSNKDKDIECNNYAWGYINIYIQIKNSWLYAQNMRYMQHNGI